MSYIKHFLIIISLFTYTCLLFPKTPAFPGAEGSGMHTTGGRGGKVLYVTSLEDSEEPGTLRWAIRKKGPRTILFKVSGQIVLQSPLKINNGDLTIAGQSAPGDGICVSNYQTTISADNVIIRFIRFRMGDDAKEPEDALSGMHHKDIIIDHCSMSWGLDEISSFYDNQNFTMQWCIIAESLRNSFHDKGIHGYGGIWGGKNATFHHNLFAHNDSRSPRFCGSRYSNRPDLERVDYRNNVIYNWGANNAYAAEGGSYNIVNNYYKPGPASSSGSSKRFLNPDADNGKNKQPSGVYGTFFVKGNYMFNNPELSENNAQGVVLGSSFKKHAPGISKEDILVDSEFAFESVRTHSAQQAFEKVLKNAGCALVRDIHDIRYVDNVRNDNFSYLGSKGSEGGLIDSQEDVGGWPIYNTYNVQIDSDEDGIPDEWLEENYPGKLANDINDEGYTYLEVYLNSLVAHLMGDDCSTKNLENNAIKEVKENRIVVSKNDSADYETVQEAINSIRAFDPDGYTTIFISNGVYKEKIVIPDYVTNLKIIGESKDKTIITFNDHAKIDNMGTFKTYTLQVRGSNIKLENLTIENNAEPLAQAVALHTEGDRIVVKNCRLIGNQDTLYTGGDGNRLLFTNSYIEGTTDFIFGSATAWFEECAIHCKKNSYITAASTPKDVDYGYIFNQCEITLNDEVSSVYLGRPWRPYAATIFMNCILPKGIQTKGWDNWRNADNEKTARYAEFNNKGEGSNTCNRVDWVKILSKNKAENITLTNVMKKRETQTPFCQ